MNFKISGIVFLASVIIYSAVYSQAKEDSIPESWQFHFQQTVITQHHGRFTSPYSGLKSLSSEKETNTSLTSTLFFGKTLWKNAALYFNPELSGGSGFSGTSGIAGFPNGETYRVGNPSPTPYIARLYLEQYINLGHGKLRLESQPNQLSEDVDSSRVRIVAGKFCVGDFFDDNVFSHDPRTQFLNWSLMSNAAWDYPANVRGYTSGLMAELIQKKWSLRFAAVLVPKEANGPTMDYNISKANGEAIEYERHYLLKEKRGTLRVLVFSNNAHMGNYNEAISNPVFANDITLTRQYGRTKYGWGINLEQELNSHLGLFLKSSWNDGRNETWAYTEIDKSMSIGGLLNGVCRKRSMDKLGIAFVINEISAEHKNYLANGGYGFIIGDGRLPHYGPELICELFYLVQFGKYLQVSPDYQFVMNPAYNQDRGPVNIMGLRAHVEI